MHIKHSAPIGVSTATNFIEEAPIIALSRIAVQAVGEFGSMLLIGGLELAVDSVSVDGPFPGVPSDRGRRRSVLVVVRAERIKHGRAGGSEGEKSAGSLSNE